MINRISCIYHPSETITNFCQDSTCLMPLCPACISEHTFYHEDQNTRPQYCSINQIISQTHAQIDNSIDSLQRDQLRNGQLIVQINMLGKKIKDKIQAVKQVIYRTIQQQFIDLEKDIMVKLQKYHSMNNVYCLETSQKKDRMIIQELTELQNLKNGLNTQRALSNIIYFFREKQNQIQSLHSEISTYLQNNQNYKPLIQLNNEAVYSLGAVISRTIKINSIPNDKNKINSRPENLRASHVLHHNNLGNQSLSNTRNKNINYTPIDKTRDNQYEYSGLRKSRNISSSASKITKINTLKPLQQSNIAYRQQSPKQRTYNQKTTKSIYKLKTDKSINKKRPIQQKNYENICRRAAQLRNQNQRISRNLNLNSNNYSNYDY